MAPITTADLLRVAEQRGRDDARAGRQPAPPFAEPKAVAYWTGYRAAKAEMKNTRDAK